jgi:hypothetical protein
MTTRRTGSEARLATQINQSIAMFIEGRNLFVQIGEDIRDWGAIMRAADGATIVNPAFDPDYCDLNRDNSFWSAITDDVGSVVGCVASKLVNTDDFRDDISTCSLWLGNRVDSETEPMTLLLPSHVPHIADRVAFHGGLWLHPSVRGLGLAHLIPRMARAAAERRFQADWHCGFVFGALGDAKVPVKAYGYSNCELAVDGYFPVTKKAEKLYLPWDSRDEWVAASLNWMNASVRPRDEQLVDQVAFR